jgi:hypothetical protein
MEHTNTVISTEAPFDTFRLTKAEFARHSRLTLGRVDRLRLAGVISDYTVAELARLRESRAAERVVDTAEECVIVRLGKPRMDGTRRIGYFDDMTVPELHDATRRYWVRHPDTLPDSDVLHVTYAGVVAGIFAFYGLDTSAPVVVNDEGLERWTYLLEPLVVVKGSLITGDRDWLVNEATLSPSQREAAERVGRQFWTPGGGPVISAYPVPAN